MMMILKIMIVHQRWSWRWRWRWRWCRRLCSSTDAPLKLPLIRKRIESNEWRWACSSAWWAHQEWEHARLFLMPDEGRLVSVLACISWERNDSGAPWYNIWWTLNWKNQKLKLIHLFLSGRIMPLEKELFLAQHQLMPLHASFGTTYHMIAVIPTTCMLQLTP